MSDKESSDGYDVNIMITRWKEKIKANIAAHVVTLIFTFVNIRHMVSSNHFSQIYLNNQLTRCIELLFDY